MVMYDGFSNHLVGLNLAAVMQFEVLEQSQCVKREIQEFCLPWGNAYLSLRAHLSDQRHSCVRNTHTNTFTHFANVSSASRYPLGLSDMSTVS